MTIGSTNSSIMSIADNLHDSILETFLRVIVSLFEQSVWII